jgi:hypothetical protein
MSEIQFLSGFGGRSIIYFMHFVQLTCKGGVVLVRLSVYFISETLVLISIKLYVGRYALQSH